MKNLGIDWAGDNPASSNDSVTVYNRMTNDEESLYTVKRKLESIKHLESRNKGLLSHVLGKGHTWH